MTDYFRFIIKPYEAKEKYAATIKEKFHASFITIKLAFCRSLPPKSNFYICGMTKEQVQDLRDRVTSLRRHL